MDERAPGAGASALRQIVVVCAGIALAAGAAFLLPRALAPSAPPADGPAEAIGHRIEREGLQIDLRLEALEGGAPRSFSPAAARFTIRDVKTGEPVRGLAPLAWMWRDEDVGPPDEGACKDRVRTYLGGKLSARAEIDFNAFLLLALNDDNTISVINPQIAFARTKLLKLITLASPPADWALQPDGSLLWVTLPTTDGLAVIDGRELRVLSTLATGEEPGQVAVAPDGRSVWVGNDGGGSVTVFDVASRRPIATLATGAGRQRIAFVDEGRGVAVAASRAGTVTFFDAASREKRAVVDVGVGIVDLAASDAAGVLVATRGRAGEVVIVDRQRAAVTRRVRLGRGITRVAFDPAGRWAFVLHPEAGRLTILDPAGAAPARAIGGFAEPDSIAFTEDFAYVRNRRAPRMTLIQLDDLEKGAEPGVFEIPIGERLPADAKVTAAASPIAPLPDDGGAFVAAPADGTLVYYHEGMMAPSGNHRNYGRRPQAVLVLDRTLREREPGVYSNVVQLGAAGDWNLAFFLDNPRVVHCVGQSIAATGDEKIERPLELLPLVDEGTRLRAGDRAVVRFRVESPDDAPLGAEEIDLVAVRPPHTWHRRLEVRAGIEPGIFEAEFEPPEPGRYQLNVAVPGRGARLGSLAPITLYAIGRDVPAEEAKR